MSFGSGYSAAVLADAPLGYWQLGEAEGYAQAVLADNPVGYWRLGDSESYAQAVLRDGAIGFWRLDEASGATGADSSGNGRTVNYVAPITYGAPGVLSTGTTGVTFPGGQTGNTGYATINGTQNVPVGTGPLSFECWVQTGGAGSVPRFIADNKVGSSNGAGFSVSVSTSGFVTFALGNGSAYTETTTPVGSPVVADGRWHHVVVVLERLYDAVHDRQRIYVDGVLQRSADVPAAGWNVTSTNAIFLSRWVTSGNPGGFDFPGSIDEVAWYQTALNAAQVANHYALRLSTRSTTAALITTDTTPAGKHGTYVGGVTLAQSGALADGTTAALFDGTSGVVKVPVIATIGGAAACTLEGWINFNGVSPTAGQRIFANAGNVGHYLQTQLTVPDVSLRIAGAQTHVVGSSVSLSGWHHVVATWVSGSVIRLYQDGVQVNTSAILSGTLDAVSSFSIGAFDQAAPSGFFPGSIDDVAVYTYALTPQQVANHYALRLSTVGAATGYAAGVRADAATGFWRLGEAEGYAQAVRSDAPFVYLRLGESAGAGTAADSSGNARSGTYNAGAAPGSAGVLLDGNGAADFSGAANANVTNTNSIGGITVAASFEAFVYADTLTGGVNKAVFSSDFGDTYVVIDGSNLPFASFRIAGVQRTLGGVAALTTGSWWHIVATYDGDKIRLYINGSLVSTSASFVGALGFGSATWRVGTSKPGTEPFDGRIDEFAIYPIALSAQQVATHYALRMSTITTVSVATVADAVAGQTGTVQPGVALGQSGPFPDGTTAAVFDGVTGFITIPDTPAQNPGLGSYSYELWCKRAAGIAASEFLICKAAGGGGAGSGGELFMGNGGGVSSRLGAKTVSSSAILNLADGQWHHIVLSMNRAVANGGQFYVDGIASGPAVDLTSEAAINLSGNAQDLLIGKRPIGNLFTGAIKDVSIYNTALTAGAAAAHYARGVSALVALDSSVNGRTGTYASGVTLGQAGAVPVDPAALFDGVTGAVRIGNYNLPASFSMEAFVKTTDASAGNHAIVSTLDSAANSVQFGFVSGHLRMTVDSGTPVTLDTAANLADGAYHHVVVTNNGTTTTFYVDGVQVLQSAQTHAAHASPWQLARDPAGTSLYLGTLDDVAVYGTVLTPTQVATHYAARLAGVPLGSVSTDSEEEDEIYDRLRGFYGPISGSYFVLATDTGTITLVPAVPKHTHFVQRLEVQITTPLAGAVWTLQDGAGAPIAVAPFPASAVGHYVIDLGPQGVPCTEATSLVLSISGGGSGAVGWVAWEGFKQLTLGAAA